MAKYIINNGMKSTPVNDRIEAETYHLQDGYFHFIKDSEKIYSIAATHVVKIVRDDS